jgi:uncharacterized membrane protein
VVAGAQAVYLLTIENRSTEAQALSLSATGLPPSWYRIDFDSARRSFPGERRTATLIVSVPADAQAAVLSIEIAASSGTAESKVACQLQVAAEAARASTEAPQISLTPSAITWRGGGQGFERLTLNVRNPGNEAGEYVTAVIGLERSWYTLPSRIRVSGAQAIDFEMRIAPPGRASPGTYAFSVTVGTEGSSSPARAEAILSVVADASDPGVQRDVSPLMVDRQPAPARPSEPVLPPEVTLGPRPNFRFGQGEIAAQGIITVTNRSRLIERYQITVTGLDADWYTLQNAEVRLEPNASAQVPLRLTPRSGPDAPAGDYDFTVRVAPVSYPDSFADVGGVISIQGVAAFDARLTPAQTSGRKEKFKLTLINTGGIPLSLWIEASDPEGLCKFKYPPPPNLEPGDEAVVPIWVGANRNGLVGAAKRLDFRLRVSPAGGASQSARSFDARFVHQPFIGARMLSYSALIAFCAMIIGLLLSMGTSTVSQAVTSVSCGFDDDYQETRNGPVFVYEKCGGAPIACQKGFCGPTVTPQPPTPGPAPPTVTPPPGPACAGSAQLGITLNRAVTIRDDARIRSAAGLSAPQIARGNGRAATVIGGPRCVDNLVWWNIDAGVVKGWTAEADENAVQLILPR